MIGEAITTYAMYSLIVTVAWDSYILSLMMLVGILDYYVNRRG